jgi:hypothetical protein
MELKENYSSRPPFILFFIDCSLYLSNHAKVYYNECYLLYYLLKNPTQTSKMLFQALTLQRIHLIDLGLGMRQRERELWVILKIFEKQSIATLISILLETTRRK